MKNISIIIGGTRYDAVPVTKEELMDYKHPTCHYCALDSQCNKYNWYEPCADLLGGLKIFKKSSKKFEK